MSTVKYDMIEKVPLTDLLDDLLFDVTDMPDDAAAHLIRRAAIKMAQRGNILRREVQLITEKCVENYLLEPPDCVDVHRIFTVCNSNHCACRDVHRLTSEPCRMPCGSYSWFTYPNEIHFTEAGCGNCYKVRFSVSPRHDACEIDAIYRDKYYELLLLGAKAFAYEMIDKPWSNRTFAQELNQRFLIGIADAGATLYRGYQMGFLKQNRKMLIG